MTKGELITALRKNKLSNDTEVLISVKKYHDGEATWDEIASVDKIPKLTTLSPLSSFIPVTP